MSWSIETEDLGKKYGKVTAVEDLCLRVRQGEIYAFLGLNGAGKTTTIRMLLGMIKPTSGRATVLQTRVRSGVQTPWAQVGYLVETPHAYPELTVYESLEVTRRLHPGTSPKAVGEMIDRLCLGEYAYRRSGNLSLGNAQRLGLAKALLHHPRLIMLDEPANGLDPAGIVEIRQLLLELTQEEGCTVFMSSHILGEVSRLAQRIGIIHKGHLLQELNRNELEQNRKRRLLVRARDLTGAQSALTEKGYAVELKQDGRLEVLDAAAVAEPDVIAALLVHTGFPPTQLLVDEEDLECYFLRLVGMTGAVQ
jgi:ABC-2 type transport system ATP-binding protein